MNPERGRFLAAVAVVFGLSASGCAATVVTPGTPRSVARAAAAAYVATGHRCEVHADLAYCDLTGDDLPLLIGYDSAHQKLMFATVLDTEANFGRPCATVPADQVPRPQWMMVQCDEVVFADKSKKTVLSVLGGERVPDRGMSPAELNRTAVQFMREAQGFLMRLTAQLGPAEQRTSDTPVTTQL
jgi:hypothetical protein